MLKWKQSMPTDVGWYWHKTPGRLTEDPAIYQVTEHPRRGLVVNFKGTLTVISTLLPDLHMWAGPIIAPGEDHYDKTSTARANKRGYL